MRKLNFLKMMLLAVVMMAGSVAWGQETVFSEKMGNATGTTSIANNSFDNSNFTFSGTGDVRVTSVSSGYTTASGGANVMINAINEYFQISGINTNNYVDLSLSFGLRKGTTAENGSNMSIQVSSDGTTWSNLSISLPTGTGTATWHYVTPIGSIPSATNLHIKFTGLSATEFRIDDILLTGTLAGIIAPTFTPASSATVDAPFDVTFTSDAAWESAITEITVDGTTLDASAYTVTSGNIQFNPSQSVLLRSAGTKSIVVKANEYTDATVSQSISAGVATALTITTQPTAPAVNGQALASQPVLSVKDQYGNNTSGTVVAAKGDAGNWTLGGTASVAAVDGVVTFTDLTATSEDAVTDAYLTFTLNSLSVNSNTFNIPAPPAQLDWVNLQHPGSGTVNLGGSYVAYAQVYEPGLTDAEGQGANVTAWIGYSTTDSDPSNWTNWVEATYKGDDGNNDEYQADLGAAMTAEGTYYYASRFKWGDADYVYGGFNGGFWNGTTNVSGVLTVNPAPTLDWVNLQYPATADITSAQSVDVYAQVYELGLTEAAGQGAGVTAWIGYSTTDSDPSTWTNWVEATFNAQSGNNDEYKATLSGLSAGTYYYASRFKYGLAEYVYGGLNGFWHETDSKSGILTVTTAEPTEHVTGFTASLGDPAYSSIKLDWTDASDADAYLIKGSAISYDDITAPVDGTTEADGKLVANVASGEGTYTFTGLTAGTNYYFKIYPYNGTAANINFKTDETVPQADIATDPMPTTWLVEDFDYAAGSLLTANGWTAHSGSGTQAIDVVVPGLTFNGYVGSGIGGAARVDNNGEDVNKTFTPLSSGSLYAAFVMSAGSTNAAGYFFHLMAGSSFTSRVWVDANGTKVGIGTSATVTITPNTPTLIVVKYDFATKVSSLYVLNSMSLTEPTTANAIYTETATIDDISAVALRQYGTNQNIIVDGIRVVTRWEDLIGDLPTFTGTGDWTTTSNWSTSAVPANTDNVIIDGDATISSNVEVAGMIINEAKSLTVNADNQLTLKNGSVNNGTIKLLSDASGTATLVGDISGTAEVQQYIDEKRTYYMGAPVSALTAVSGIENISTFDITTDTWAGLLGASKDNIPTGGKGFLAQAPTGTVQFNGTLNSGNIEIPLQQSSIKNFNYYGNPYPSYLNSSKVLDGGTTDGTIWQRTKGTTGFIFVTYNKAGDGATLPSGYDGSLIAPMQGFWVNATATGTFNFTNDMRVHKSGDVMFKAPRATVTSQRLLLAISNGTTTDEALVRFNEGAGTGVENWDSRKMMNAADALNIFTVDEGVNLAINSYPAISYNTEIPVGINVVAGNYTISAKEFSGFAEENVVNLIDTQEGKVTDLTKGDYSFTLGANLNSTSRFALVFPKSDVPTGLDSEEFGSTTILIRDNQIVVHADESLIGASVHVYNGVGQRVASQNISDRVNVLNGTFAKGVYVVNINNFTQKVIIK